MKVKKDIYMQGLLKFLIKSRLKQKYSYSVLSVSGFTMIELLVGTIIAFLITVPMLGFVVDILNRDVKEQAKATTEREIQAAAEYLSQDLSQAIYIYDPEDEDFETFRAQLPYEGEDDKTLSLVFWKRHLITNAICPESFGDPITGCSDDEKDDIYVYSLVAYYLIDDDNAIWCQPAGSNCKRIARVQIRDGIKDPDNFTQYIAENDKKIGRSKGYNPDFDINKPLEWTNSGEEFPSHDVLVNYIEDFSELQVTNNRLAKIEIVGNAKRRIPGQFKVVECTDIDKDRTSPYCPTVAIQVRAGGSVGT
ncbi:MAG: type II secretion system protein, partial [Okeania sp. SIO3B3]|nr:type II secretion system protein [Okeania sp. SIO3B3]